MRAAALLALLLLACTPPPIRNTNRGVLWVSVEGTDLAPAESASFDVGTVRVGSRKEVVLRATNTGVDALNVTGVYLGSAGNGSFYVRDVSGKLEPEQSLTATVTFSPATAGAQQTQVTFSHDAESALPSVTLTGMGG